VDQSNPYAQPSSKVAATQSGLAGSTRILLACLVGAQIVVTLFSLPDGLHRVRYGDIPCSRSSEPCLPWVCSHWVVRSSWHGVAPRRLC